jgi:putative iron-only hydrogenase system regulator
MEKKIGTITILIRDREVSPSVNKLLSGYADIILCRQGLPFHDRPVAVISLIVEGEMNRINALTGSLGRLQGLTSKAMVV